MLAPLLAGREVLCTGGRMDESNLKPMMIGDLIAEAAKPPRRYSDEWFSAYDPDQVFSLSDLAPRLRDSTAQQGGEWAYEADIIYYRYTATSAWSPAWYRVP